MDVYATPVVRTSNDARPSKPADLAGPGLWNAGPGNWAFSIAQREYGFDRRPARMEDARLQRMGGDARSNDRIVYRTGGTGRPFTGVLPDSPLAALRRTTVKLPRCWSRPATSMHRTIRGSPPDSSPCPWRRCTFRARSSPAATIISSREISTRYAVCRRLGLAPGRCRCAGSYQYRLNIGVWPQGFAILHELLRENSLALT